MEIFHFDDCFLFYLIKIILWFLDKKNILLNLNIIIFIYIIIYIIYTFLTENKDFNIISRKY